MCGSPYLSSSESHRDLEGKTGPAKNISHRQNRSPSLLPCLPPRSPFWAEYLWAPPLLPKLMYLSSTPQCDGIWSWGPWQIIKFRNLNGDVLIGRERDRSSFSLHHVKTQLEGWLRASQEESPHQERGLLTLVLDFPGARTVRSKCLYRSCPACGIHHSPSRLRQFLTAGHSNCHAPCLESSFLLTLQTYPKPQLRF